MHGRYYTYALVDSRNKQRFYIGKGMGDRMYQHEKDARRLLKTRYGKMKLQPKHKRIIDIWNAGASVKYEVLFRSNLSIEAECAESWWIEAIGLERLTNETWGRNCK